MPNELIVALVLGIAGAGVVTLPRYVRGSVVSAVIGAALGFASVTFGSSLYIADGAHASWSGVDTPFFDWRGNAATLTLLAVLVGAALGNLAFWLFVTLARRKSSAPAI